MNEQARVEQWPAGEVWPTDGPHAHDPPPRLTSPVQHAVRMVVLLAMFAAMGWGASVVLGDFLVAPPPVEVQLVSDDQSVSVARDARPGLSVRAKERILRRHGVLRGPLLEGQDVEHDFGLIAEHGRRVQRGRWLVILGTALVLLVVVGLLCGRVAYRPFDIGFALVPVYGFVFVARILWRIAAPYAYWDDRVRKRAR